MTIPRKTRNVMAIGCAHLGIDRDIAELFANCADLFKCSATYHLGAILTKDEMIAYHTAVGKSRIYENQIKEILKTRGMTETEAAQWDSYIERISSAVETVEKTQAARLAQLQEYFPGVRLVINEEQYVPSDEIKESGIIIDHSTKVCKWLTLTSIHANGDRVAHTPITDRCYNAMRNVKTSVILPHPTPQLRPFSKPGLNQAHHYLTTGMLKHQEKHNRPSESFKAMNRPRAHIISIDEASGEFHITDLCVDYVGGIPTVLVDGFVITPTSITETDEKAIATADEHAPLQSREVFVCVASCNNMYQADTHIHVGDIGEFESMNPHAKGRRQHLEGKRLIDDVMAVRSLMINDVHPACVNRVLVLGNHDIWPTRRLEEYPEFIGILDWPALLKNYFTLPKINLKVVGVDNSKQEIYQWGDTVIRHGDKEHLETAVQIFGKVLRGHDHRHTQYLDGQTMGTSGALWKGFIADRITSHLWQFATGTKHKGVSRFACKIVLASGNKARYCYRCQIYEAPVK